jgi:AcrR family transcriptional regulator
VGDETRGGGLGRRSADDAERTRSAIVGAALFLFAERGFEGVSLRDIAQEAGTTHGLIRHHFGSKEGVWRAVVDAADGEYVAALMPILSEVESDRERGDPVGTASMVVRGIVMVSARHPEIVRLLVHESTRGGERLDYILERLGAPRRLLAPVLAGLHRQGLLRRFDADTFFLFLLTAGAMPFALPALTGILLGEETPLREEGARQYADRLTATLFGGQVPPQA